MSGIRVARSAGEIEAIRLLFREYAAAANAPECFVALEAELATLPGEYAPPDGRLFIAGDAVPAGCVALRRLDADCAEIKRLYVRDAHRGTGLGRRLAAAAIEAARATGARRVVLDTLPSMQEAHALYRSLGFRETGAYLATPTPGASCFALDL
jgi:GNAT superfamily N-acetyltransferase